MASDLGQNRYSDFVALETLLRFENCSSSHCLLSSWRRFLVVESTHPSFHRTVFFGAPLAFLRGVAMGLCRRCIIFMSSCRRVFLSSTALHTWAGTWCMGTYCTDFTCISYAFPFLLGTLLVCYAVTLLLCYLVTLLLCYLDTLLLCYPVTLLRWYSVNYLATLLPCNLVTLLACYPVPWYSVTLLLCYLVTLLPCYSVSLLPCYLVTMLPCYSVILSPCYSVTLFPCYSVTLLPCYSVSLFPWDMANIL